MPPLPQRFPHRTPTDPVASPAEGRWSLVGLLVAVGLGVVLLSTRTGPDAAPMVVEALAAFAAGWLPAAAWLLYAFGVGRVVAPLVPREVSGPERTLVVAALGVGVAAWLDSLAGRLGILTAGGGVVAWGLVAGFGVPAVLAFIRRGRAEGVRLAASWSWLALVPALSVLLLASLAAPGWLWSSEFGGYDALSYHLQLPKEWLGIGAIAPLEHNAYSHLPNHLEASTLHLMAMLRDPLAAAIPAQSLEAMLAILVAGLVGATVRRLAGGTAGLVAAGVLLGLPWMIVCGSLAYDEMGMLLPLAAGLAILLRDRAGEADREWRPRAITVGLLAATAVGAKASAVGLVAVPLGVLLVASLPPRCWLAAGLLGIAAAMPILAPWLLHNQLTAGQPFFPLLASVLGGGGWSAEQAAIFDAAHHGELAGAAAIVREWLLHGVGPAPAGGEPWRPQWSLLPILGIASLIVLAGRPATRWLAWRLVASIAVMLAFWLLATHLKSRFLLPTAVPLAIAVGAACAPLAEGAAARRLLAVAVLAWGLVPIAIFLRERAPEGSRFGSPAAATGQVAAVSGELHARLLRDPGRGREERAFILSTAPPWTFLNDPGLTGSEGRVLLVGESRAFYLRRAGEYAVVWNRGRLSRLVREHPADPERWRRELRDAGFDHVLLDRAMIDRWRRDGWWDPVLTAEAIESFADALRPLQRFPNGVELLAIPSAAASVEENAG